jgi:hypothetical protein
MNILFIMYDQLRFDYLSCAGHPHLATPNFDRLAAMGVRFTECLCAVADLRRQPDELLHRPLRPQHGAQPGTAFRSRSAR